MDRFIQKGKRAGREHSRRNVKIYNASSSINKYLIHLIHDVTPYGLEYVAGV